MASTYLRLIKFLRPRKLVDSSEEKLVRLFLSWNISTGRKPQVQFHEELCVGLRVCSSGRCSEVGLVDDDVSPAWTPERRLCLHDVPPAWTSERSIKIDDASPA